MELFSWPSKLTLHPFIDVTIGFDQTEVTVLEGETISLSTSKKIRLALSPLYCIPLFFFSTHLFFQKKKSQIYPLFALFWGHHLLLNKGDFPLSPESNCDSCTFHLIYLTNSRKYFYFNIG